MLPRLLMVVVLALAGWSNTATAEQAAPDDLEQQASKHMEIGRWYIGRGDYTGATNRFTTVVRWFQVSAHVEEVLARLVETYLALGRTCEARYKGAVLDRDFRDGRWTVVARNALKAAGLEPLEDIVLPSPTQDDQRGR